MEPEAEDELAFKAIALACSAMCWSGLTAVRGNRGEEVIKTAEQFVTWLKA
jgi:hypothetical protein